MRFDENELLNPPSGRNGKNNRNKNRDDRRRDDRDRNRDRNRDERKKENKPVSNAPSPILSSGMDLERGSGDRVFDEEVKEDLRATTDAPDDVLQSLDIIENFLDDYADACKLSGNQVIDVIRDSFWDVAKVMTHYYDPKYNKITGEMNKVLDIVSAQRFAVSLFNLLNGEEIEGWNDGEHDIWKDIMFVTATAVVTCHNKMKDETVSTYIDLISSSGLAGKDIDRLVKELGITKDLAVDLTVSIPVIPDDMTDITLKQFFGTFAMKMMEHAEENIDVLDRGTQGRLFSFFFGKGHIALKAIGRMLAAPRITGFQNESQKVIYAEYLSMLSDRLDAYDIKDIKYVIRFIVNERKRLGKDAATAMLFSNLSIVEYNSIRKAELELIRSDADAKEYLTMG